MAAQLRQVVRRFRFAQLARAPRETPLLRQSVRCFGSIGTPPWLSSNEGPDKDGFEIIDNTFSRSFSSSEASDPSDTLVSTETDAQKMERLASDNAHLRATVTQLQKVLRDASPQMTVMNPIARVASEFLDAMSPTENNALKLKVESLEAENNALKLKVKSLQSQISALQAEDSKKQHQISALQAEDSKKQHQISALQAEDSKKQHQISALQAEDSKKQHQISALQAEDSKKQQQITQLETFTNRLLNEETKRNKQREVAELITLFISRLSKANRKRFWDEANEATNVAIYDVALAETKLNTLLSSLAVPISACSMLELMEVRRNRNHFAHPVNFKDAAACAGFVAKCAAPGYFKVLGDTTVAAVQELVTYLQT